MSKLNNKPENVNKPTTTYGLPALQSFLNTAPIPKQKKYPQTFLGIAKQPHYENVLSNMYEFFFNKHEVHNLRDLFIKSLLELIAESKLGESKKSLQDLSDFDIYTEYGTKNGGRIDILLRNDEHAIIIENKVYHHLENNDLDDYWNSVELNNTENINKIGVILSLHRVAEKYYSKFDNSSHYINLTHLTFLNRVMDNCGSYLMNANDKYVTFMKDLYQNIKNLSTIKMKPNEIEFYLENKGKINQLLGYKSALRNHLEEEVKQAGFHIPNVNVRSFTKTSQHGNRIVNFHSIINNDLMIMVVYGDLLKVTKDSKTHILEIKIKIERSLMDFKSIFEKTIIPKQLTSNSNGLKLAEDKTFKHLAGKRYILNVSEILNLSNHILEILENDQILDVFRQLENKLSTIK